MTPNTTPAPMTHEPARWYADHEGTMHRNQTAPYVLFTDWEAERTRADALAAEVESLRSRVEAAEGENRRLTMFEESESAARDYAEKQLEAAESRIAELEAGIGTALKFVPDIYLVGYGCTLADFLRSLIGHKEGNGDG